jgi:retron-type reverse transcriptase
MGNLILAWRKARKGKTKKDYVIKFEENLIKNLLNLHEELKNQTYFPKPLKTFILRDPKTRKISKATFRDRIVHHAIVNILEPIFEKVFIYDNCANRKGKGNLFALKRFDKFKKKVTKNGKCYRNKFEDLNSVFGYCLKADIKHYFQEVNHEILLDIIKRKVRDKKLLELIKKILDNNVESNPIGKGMPLGNLTSQFFANVYLDRLDKFVKHKLRAKYYIRYVDDFVILHESKEKLGAWRTQINEFLGQELKLELHKDKSQVLPLSRGVDFAGFRNFYYFRLLRKRNINSIKSKIKLFNNELMSYNKFVEIFQGWNAYAIWANSYKLRNKIIKMIIQTQNRANNLY